MKRRDLFTIPNLMGYFRILMIPVFMYLYYSAESTKEYAISFIALAVSYLTDFFDGRIARKFDCVTEFGKVLDPFADKLTQCAIAIAVCIRFKAMIYFLVLFVCKEFYMGLMGIYLLKKYQKLNAAQMYGKIYTWVVDMGVMALLFFANMPTGIANGIVVFMIVVLIATWILYLKFHFKIIKKCREKIA